VSSGPPRPQAVTLADINADGHLDILGAGNNGTAQVLLGKGDGTFQTPLDLAVGANAFGIAVGDLDGDGRADLVTASIDDHTVSVLLNNSNNVSSTEHTSVLLV
jgi:hypothetical protein